MTSRVSFLWRAAAIAAVVGLLAAGPADARRGGSFGSRGYRTYSAPRPTSISPGYTAPVQRSMTARPAYGAAPSYSPGYAQPASRGGFGGMGGFLSGVLAGGLIGSMLGHHGGYGGGGWGGYGGGGGGGGLLTILVQLAIFAGLAWLAVTLFRRVTGRRGAASSFAPSSFTPSPAPSPSFFGGSGSMPNPSYPPYAAPPYGGTQSTALEFPVTATDEAAFERLLVEIQDAFGREDFAALRERTTPEVMSYLAEELSQNTVQGVRNSVSNTRLLQADISESWRENQADYVTAALRYESVDVMRDRATGAVRSGDPTRATPTTELWTFVRPPGGAWKLSAIQET